MDNMSIIIGQVVQVKEGQLDEDTGTSLAGWSGRVVAIYPEYGSVEIAWDSLTLLQLTDAYICQSLDGGYDYLQYCIEPIHLAIIEPKDTPEQVQDIREELEARYHDYELYGEPSIPFSTVEREAFTADLVLPQTYAGWLEYLEKQLVFPFRAKVVEGNRDVGQQLDILALDNYEDLYGIISIVKWIDGGGGNFLLCDLEAIDKDSANYHILRKYVVWFANQ